MCGRPEIVVPERREAGDQSSRALRYEMAETELRTSSGRFVGVADEDDTWTPIAPPGLEEVAEMARFLPIVDDAWMEWTASSTPGADPPTP